MLRCVSCKYNNDCAKVIYSEMENCTEYYPLTNADRIRAMRDEELAVICEDGCPPNHECPPINKEEIGKQSACQQCWLDWLKQEATE